MPVLAGQTREQIRGAIGYNLMGSQFIVSSTTRASQNAGDVVDRDRLFGGNNAYNGRWVYLTSGGNDGEIRRVNDFVQGTVGDNSATSHQLIVQPEFTNNIASGVTYELWEARWDPRAVEQYINDAVLEVYGRAFDPEEDTSLHTGGGALSSLAISRSGGGVSRFAIPSGMDAIQHVEFRERVNSSEIHACDRLFDQTEHAEVTQANDTQDFRRGGKSLRLTVGDGLDAGDLIADSITSLDLSGRTTVELWIKSSTALDAGDWVLLLNDGSSDKETLSIPAVTANTWTRVSIALVNPHFDTAITSVKLEMNVDKGVHTVWFDDIVAVDPTTADWCRLSRSSWSVEREGGYLILKYGALSAAGYTQLKLLGGGAPVLLTADSTVTEVSAWWIIARATELAFQRAGADFKGDSILWGDKAKVARKGLMRLRGARSTA